MTVYNKTGVDQDGRLEIYSSGGDLLTTIDNVSIPAGEKTSVDITYGAKSDKPFGEKDWNTLKFVGQDNEYTLDIPLNMQDKISLSFDHAEVPVNQLSEISVAVTNESTSSLSGTLKVTPPEGWTLDSTQKSYTLNAGETEHVTFSVVSRRQTAFNFYNFAFEAYDEEGRVLQRLERPLDFAVVVKVDRPIETSEFTGDISDWSNAYPTYLNPPEDPDSMEAWRTIDVAARIFTKWDEENFYILADVYDLYHNQENPGSLLYSGDSVQFAIDADHTKSTAYDGGDYEYGAALDNFGTILFNAWQAPAGQTTGEKPAEWASILRNETNKNTRYFIKIP